MNVFGYLKEEDHRNALYATLVFIMLMILFFLLVSLEEPDPPIEPDIVEIEIPGLVIEQGSAMSGGSDGPESVSTPEPTQDVQESPRDIVTQEEESVPEPSGTGQSTTSETQSEPQPNTEFGFPGGGGGQGTGSGGDFGSGTGVGDGGTGNSDGSGTYNPDRKITKRPTFNAEAQEEGTVALDLWVDANGTVVRTRFNESKSTTGSQYLIGLAVKAAKTMKYDRKPGVPSEYVGYKKFTFIKA